MNLKYMQNYKKKIDLEYHDYNKNSHDNKNIIINILTKSFVNNFCFIFCKFDTAFFVVI